MHKQTQAFFAGACGLILALLSNLALAQAESFVDQASAKGIAEIETAKMALDKSQAEDIRTFAQRMIDDHTQSNQKLAKLAQEKNLEMSDQATLMDMAKAMILKLRDGEDFNAAYANNQVVAHEQTIELYREYVQNAENPDLVTFAETMLPKLEEHLQMAKALQAKYAEQQ
ncbi:DUF4142 domain-containing protein [Stutzerimonas urumqiensis]|uniref:DUF4142 domain-containing protein n=1 Tax=Stutzerimonas urumqiensis TaxID=638269 RepID=UPI000EB33273|nr:DUF4142 domain-containing protein [Stutzerimonas urumqiensis]